jgi:hypothetical protein
LPGQARWRSARCGEGPRADAPTPLFRRDNETPEFDARGLRAETGDDDESDRNATRIGGEMQFPRGDQHPLMERPSGLAEPLRGALWLLHGNDRI